jgi:aminoglycoside 6-adenylyltransferase
MAVELTYNVILERFLEISRLREDIRLVMVIGSRAREDHPADEWSDLDLVFVTSQPSEYISSQDWLTDLGEYILTFLEPTPIGTLVERRVLFEGGFDVDFVPLPLNIFQHGLPPEVTGVFCRGYQVVLDKDGLETLIASSSRSKLSNETPPNQTDYLQTVNDFLFHVVWTAKKLRRGELWTAKQCCDGYLKWLLLKMIEWHAKWTRQNQKCVDVWHSGRFLDQWADERVLEGLSASFAHYDLDVVWQALRQTSNLFSRLATEVAMSVGLRYPDEAFSKVTDLVDSYQVYGR